MRKTLCHLIFLILIFLGGVALADTSTSGWTWGVNCPGEGTFGTANFTASAAGGFQGSGTCARTSTYFTKFNFTSSSGGTLASSTIFAHHTGDVLVVPPTLSGSVQPIFTVQTYCPIATQALNWIFVQWDSGTDTLQNTYLLGSANYNTSTGVTVTGQYDVTGSPYYLGSDPMSGSCSGGIYTSTSSNSAELGGTIYFTANGAGVYKTGLGHATFFFPQYTVTAATDLGSATAPGMSFDSTSSTHTRQVQVTTSSAGTTFTVQPYLDPNAGTIDASYTDTITISHTNTPQSGMLIGTVTRTGTGAGTGKVACIVNKDFDKRVFCTGQSPSSNSYPYTTTFVIQTICPTGYVRVPKNPDVGTYHDFCIAKYEMANVSGVATSTSGQSPWVNISQTAAITACQNLGTGYDLILNAEWQAVARDVETAYSGGSYLNWTNGSQSSGNGLSEGNWNNGIFGILATDSGLEPLLRIVRELPELCPKYFE